VKFLDLDDLRNLFKSSKPNFSTDINIGEKENVG
jgi:hypothetical protein